jgi:hypothetical protein
VLSPALVASCTLEIVPTLRAWAAVPLVGVEYVAADHPVGLTYFIFMFFRFVLPEMLTRVDVNTI